MEKGLRRPTLLYVTHLIMIGLGIWQSMDHQSWSWIIISVFGVISLINILVNPFYLEVLDNELIIHRDFFRTTRIPLKEIDKFWIEIGAFKSSKIILKDGSNIKYSDQSVSDKKLIEFVKQYDILVE